MSFTIPVCAACRRATFPLRALCPLCGGTEWTSVESESGTVEEVTERNGVRIASVRTDLGPVVIARTEATAADRGDVVGLESDHGVPVVPAEPS